MNQHNIMTYFLYLQKSLQTASLRPTYALSNLVLVTPDPHYTIHLNYTSAMVTKGRQHQLLHLLFHHLLYHLLHHLLHQLPSVLQEGKINRIVVNLNIIIYYIAYETYIFTNRHYERQL